MNTFTTIGLLIFVIGAGMLTSSFMIHPGSTATALFIFGIVLGLIGAIALIAGFAVKAVRKS